MRSISIFAAAGAELERGLPDRRERRLEQLRPAGVVERDETDVLRYAARDALHDLGPGAHRSDEIVAALDRPSSELSSIRTQLLKKDVIVAPSRGVLEFRLPLTSSYIERHRRALHLVRSGATPRRDFRVSFGAEYATGKPDRSL